MDIDQLSNRHRSHLVLLCYVTLCIFLLVAIFFIATKVLHRRRALIHDVYDKHTAFNILEFRQSLVHCGRHVIKQNSFYPKVVHRLLKSLNNNNNNNTRLIPQIPEYFYDQQPLEVIIIHLKRVVQQCLPAYEYSLQEQEKPTSIRQFINKMRKEFLYMARYFTKGI
ncbi:unnamed protein product [Didymodactylos carnosus]|uniref:Uncharacterized protein n=1 Tax=Didymodactylos carnosus TaxID=1234261 RepID=A0A814MJX1_9BILA|nr:unnamed protein product [Didymodactylos carnosus]CAF1158776.1 unnamed protein product [Didymodactylos carnosus]CAF3846016.1 unnamed protein product [Didymodactylos carnosus]CAF3970310.1 unnamed protein product [Didymodactylos carnosus]